MIKRRKKSATALMRRACRVYLDDLNAGKADTLRAFLRRCRDIGSSPKRVKMHYLNSVG